MEIPVTAGVSGNKPRWLVVGADVTLPNSLELLTHRLDQLRAERASALADSLRDTTGDIADRATNVEASIRLQLLDERISLLSLEIEELKRSRHADGVVSVGDRVQLDLGDGPEEYLVGSVEQAAAGVPTVTPGSPLGRAIVGAEVGSTVTYEPRPGVRLEVRVLDAEGTLVRSA
ncbi:MAG TPA: GreA/GreB family elongation factor [Nocardioides sp.]|uniref:GreA/GreB family elongation factor n=1 Tax=Nocardioides sp. TaxID=35761 RepID=UPI002E3453F1|nr:GreA/GreB family elongation factor [Nocardioides sp.]HEX5089761.1 GreA/GreB family elongation factor [Nocardioides sp.]